MPKQNGDPTLREIKQRHANELCDKANEIFRLKQTIAAMTETAEEANRSYISQHNQIQELQAATLAAEARIRELEADAKAGRLFKDMALVAHQNGEKCFWVKLDAALAEHKENQG